MKETRTSLVLVQTQTAVNDLNLLERIL